MNSNIALPGIHDNVSATHSENFGLHPSVQNIVVTQASPDVSNTYTVAPGNYHSAANPQPTACEVRSDLAVGRTVASSVLSNEQEHQEHSGGKNRSVSVTLAVRYRVVNSSLLRLTPGK